MSPDQSLMARSLSQQNNSLVKVQEAFQRFFCEDLDGTFSGGHIDVQSVLMDKLWNLLTDRLRNLAYDIHTVDDS